MPTGSSAWPAAGLAVAVPPASEVLKYQSYTVPIVHLGLKSQSQHSRSLWLRTAVPVPPAEPWIEPQSQSGTGTVCVLGGGGAVSARQPKGSYPSSGRGNALAEGWFFVTLFSETAGSSRQTCLDTPLLSSQGVGF